MAYMPLNNAVDSFAFPVQIFFAISTDIEIIPEKWTQAVSTHYGLVTPYGDIDLFQYWLK